MAEGTLDFGCTAWSLSWAPPYEGAIRRIAKDGFKYLELVAWDVATLRNYYTPERIRSLRTMIDGEGLTLTNFFFNLPFNHQSGGATSKPDRDGFARAIETVAALGSPAITTMTPYPFGREMTPIMRRPTAQEWTAPVEPQWDWQGEYQNVVSTFVEASAIAAKSNLRVAIEPHPYRWVNSGQSMLRLIEQVKAENFGFNFDPSHLFPSGDMPHFTVLMLGKHIFNTHFSDNEGHTNAHFRPGRGKIDWTAIFAALASIGYDGPITLELEDAPGASHWTHTEDATEELDRELILAIEYLRARHAEAGNPGTSR